LRWACALLLRRTWRLSTPSHGVWGYTDFASDSSVQEVYAYEPGSAPRRVGCISGTGTTVHDVLVGDDELFVAVYYGPGRATILRYPL